MNRRFYSCIVCNPNDPNCDKRENEIKKNHCFIFYDDTSVAKGHFNNIKEDDIILLNMKSNFIAYGEVKRTTENTREDFKRWAYLKGEWVLPKNGIGIKIIGIDKHTMPGASSVTTIREIEKNWAIEKIREMNDDSDLYRILITE